MPAQTTSSGSAHAPPPIHIPTTRSSLLNHPSSSTPTRQTPTNGTRKLSPDTEMSGNQKPTKRARRAINCAPCRASKLKCDRARPCSGCVLRGTTNACYTTEDGEGARADDYRNDPHNGIAQIRQGLAIIEAHLNRYGSAPLSALPMHPHSHPHTNGRDASPHLYSMKRELDVDMTPGGTVPNGIGGMGGIPDGGAPEMMPDPEKGGLYVGPTSAGALLSFRNEPKLDNDEPPEPEEVGGVCSLDPLSNLDLLSMLPEVLTADALIQFFFDNCTWVHHYLPRSFFLPSWERFKSSTCTDHVLLATIFIVLALAVLYLPPDHPLLAQLGPGASPQTLALQYYSSSHSAMNRHRMSPGALEQVSPSVELIEYLLLRTQYLTICKDDCEEVWHIRGEVLSYATALGLHRDPGKWRLGADTVERRRWAWWNVVALERWHALLVGRPLAIANHHFDTLLPDGTDAFGPQPPAPGMWTTHCQFFRLCVVLGDIVDSALSTTRVPYDIVMAHDRALARWHELLPPEVRLDVYPLARALNSPILEQRRVAVQSLHLTSAMYHIQFTLHRPYTVPSAASASPESARSLETAVFAADKLIAFVCGTLDDAATALESKAHVHTSSVPSPLTVPGHMGWGPYHIFHAAVYYSFQLIWREPGNGRDSARAPLFRADIRRVVGVFERLQAQLQLRIAHKALNILRALAPLYEEVCVDTFEGECARKTSDQLAFVRRLAFPWQHESSPPPPQLQQQRHTASPASMVYTPPGNALPPPPQQQQQQQYANGLAYNMQTGGEDGLWATSLAVDSEQWKRFLKDIPGAGGGGGGGSGSAAHGNGMVVS